jgi:hypothetical protein
MFCHSRRIAGHAASRFVSTRANRRRTNRRCGLRSHAVTAERTKKPRAVRRGADSQVGVEGFEPFKNSREKVGQSGSGGSNSGNNGAETGAASPPATPADPELTALIAAWPHLPPALKAGIAAMVTAASGPAGKKK